MPQLNIETFVTQYFWLIVILFGFYIVVVTTIIPSIASSFKLRKKLTVSEDAAEELNSSASTQEAVWTLNVSHALWEGDKSSTLSNSGWIEKNL